MEDEIDFFSLLIYDWGNDIPLSFRAKRGISVHLRGVLMYAIEILWTEFSTTCLPPFGRMNDKLC